MKKNNPQNRLIILSWLLNILFANKIYRIRECDIPLWEPAEKHKPRFGFFIATAVTSVLLFLVLTQNKIELC